MMKQSLQLKLGQQLTMTPQLQQAIRLLQLSTLELQLEVQQALDSNPLLEIEEDDDYVSPSAGTDTAGSADGNDEPASDFAAGEELDIGQNEAMPDDLQVDSQWDDVYESGTGLSAKGDDDDRDFEQGGPAESLHDHLRWQIEMSHITDKDASIALAIIDAISDDGYLTSTLDSLYEGLSQEFELDMEEIETMLHAVQSLDPPGVGARDLRECMLLQLQQYDPETPWLAEARHLVSDYLDVLGDRDYNLLMRRLKLTEDVLRQVIQLIQTLNPRPGGQIASGQAEYVVPEVIVKKVRNSWRVELNPDCTPRININSLYSNMIQRADNSVDNTYLKNHLQEARWFIKSLLSRNETLLKVATCIVDRQRGFLEYGEEAMKALVLADVAEEVGMHESTISRVTNKKYMLTPRGIFELKYFFSSHVGTAGGGECSSTAIRALIKKLVAAENPRKPLSDSKLAEILEDQGINVARRTVAKYREAMAIPSSSDRKRLT